MFKKLSNVNTDRSHLTNRGIIFGLLTLAILYVITPILFFMVFGAGATSTDITNLPITKVCWALSPTLIIFPIIGRRLISNIRGGQLAKAKNYLYVGAIVFVLSGIMSYVQMN